MVTGPQQRKNSRANGRHAGGKAHSLQALFHGRDFRLQSIDRGVYLPTISVAGNVTLKYVGKISGIGISESNRIVNRLVNRTVLNTRCTVVMNNFGSETFHGSGGDSGGREPYHTSA